MPKPITYRLHAEGAIAERRLAKSWIERVVRNPEWTLPDPNDPEVELRYGPIPERGGRVLRVPVVETDSEIRILTALLDRRPRKP